MTQSTSRAASYVYWPTLTGRLEYLHMKHDGEVVVFHVQVLEPPGQGWPIETRTDAAQLVDCVIAHLLDEGVKAAGALGSASRRAIASEIVSAAASRGADLIVMGSRRRSPACATVLRQPHTRGHASRTLPRGHRALSYGNAGQR